jgi:hypothetical protein
MGKKKTHYLGENAKCEMPLRVLYVDTEAYMDTDPQEFRLGHAIYARRIRGDWKMTDELAFKNRSDFHDMMERIVARDQRHRVYVVAHGMNYDFLMLGMQRYLTEERGWEAPSTMVMKFPFLYYTSKLQEGGRKTGVRFICTMNWYRNSLANVSKMFGSFKQDCDLKTADDREVAAYCRQDVLAVKAIFEGLVNFMEVHDLGNFKPTAAGTALAALCHRFLPRKTVVVHEYPKLMKMERDSYRGGRTECFTRVSPLSDQCLEDIYDMDINSQYPSVMRCNYYPVAPRHEAPLTMTNGELPPAWKSDFVIARAQMELKAPCIAVKRDGMTVHPVGKVTAVITQPEIDWLNAHPEDGRIDCFLEGMPYVQVPNLFRDYVDFFYNLRLEAKARGDTLADSASKLYLNSAYGKLAQRLMPSELEALDLPDEAAKFAAVKQSMIDLGLNKMDDAQYNYTLIAGRLMKKPRHHLEDDAGTNHTVVAIPTAVTAYGRMLLWEIIKTAGHERCYYCDTDSVFTDEVGYKRIAAAGWMHETELGKLKMKHHETFRPYGAKDYELDGSWKCKGVKKNAVQTDWESFEQDQFMTGNSHLRAGDCNGVRVRRIEKTLTRNYKKGTTTRSGRVEPLEFHDW